MDRQMDRSKWNNMPQCADITPMMRFFSEKETSSKKEHNCICCCMNFQIFKICMRWEGGCAYHCSVVGVTLLPIVLHFSFLLLFLFSFLLSFLFSSFLFSLFASPASPCFSRHAFLPSASFPCFSRATSRNRRTTAMRFALRTMVQQGATMCKLLKETACPTTWLETNFKRYADLQVESHKYAHEVPHLRAPRYPKSKTETSKKGPQSLCTVRTQHLS